MKDLREVFKELIDIHVHLYQDTQSLISLTHMAQDLIEMYLRGGKLLIAGNGGSAADAQHFAAEITCQFMRKRRARPALALHCDTSALTAWGNDYSFETVFARQVEAHGCKGDVLMCISTSGNSSNLCHAAEKAHELDMQVFGLLGKNGGILSTQCNRVVVVPSESTPRIQECHIMLIHILCEMLDRAFVDIDVVDDLRFKV